MKLFYDHLIIHLGPVFAEIEKLKVKDIEKKRLRAIVDDTIHHTVLDTILKKLDKKHHKNFLCRFRDCPHDQKTLEYLQEKVEDIETHIQDSLLSLKDKLLSKSLS